MPYCMKWFLNEATFLPLRADAANLAYLITVGNSPGVESDIRQVSSQEYQISWTGVATLTRLLRLWVQPKARCQYALFISSTQFFSGYSFGKNYKVKFSFDFEIQTKCLIADSAVCCLGPRLGLCLTFFKANSSMAREGVFPTSLCLFSHPISLSRTTHVCQACKGKPSQMNMFAWWVCL